MSHIAIASRMPRHEALVPVLEAAGHTVTFIRTPEALAAGAWKSPRPDYVFFPHWSHRIPAEVHEAFECVVFHMADLPRGRGGSPVQNLISRGYESTHLCALRCVEAMDAGPVYARSPISLLGTADEILDRAAALMGPMILDIAARRPAPVPQEGEPTVFRRRTPADGDLAPLADLRAVFDHIRMLDGEGYPPAFVHAGGFTFEFSRASLKPGRVLADVTIRQRQDKE